MSINKKRIIPFLVATVILFSPMFIFAAADATASKDSTYFPICACCAKDEPCTLYDFFAVVDKLIKALLYLSFFIAVIMIIKGGITILLANGKEADVTKGRQTVTWAIYGMIVAFGAWLIINTVLTVLTGSGIATYLTF